MIYRLSLVQTLRTSALARRIQLLSHLQCRSRALSRYILTEEEAGIRRPETLVIESSYLLKGRLEGICPSLLDHHQALSKNYQKQATWLCYLWGLCYRNFGKIHLRLASFSFWSGNFRYFAGALSLIVKAGWTVPLRQLLSCGRHRSYYDSSGFTTPVFFGFSSLLDSGSQLWHSWRIFASSSYGEETDFWMCLSVLETLLPLWLPPFCPSYD